MNYFKVMIGFRVRNSDGWSASYGRTSEKHAGYGNSERFKELINRDRRAKKKWVKNHEAKLMRKDEQFD